MSVTFYLMTDKKKEYGEIKTQISEEEYDNLMMDPIDHIHPHVQQDPNSGEFVFFKTRLVPIEFGGQADMIRSKGYEVREQYVDLPTDCDVNMGNSSYSGIMKLMGLSEGDYAGRMMPDELLRRISTEESNLQREGEYVVEPMNSEPNLRDVDDDTSQGARLVDFGVPSERTLRHLQALERLANRAIKLTEYFMERGDPMLIEIAWS